ncbi:response regulator [Cypionkella sp.]|jgi:two-component system phosphate regulon response regulator OmpR|uniref:response regulator n=1 Tax=Cypionkella sp. TaxID=2811411 RepID=UPI002727A5B1|nr:response regulator [Cypionkella sp.]MDO8984011.1 response regulator [Cypionkella sp.]MDP1576069.1 response regulator [Cypionkella sp.]MDP2049211.1 response regulator [Cypionkella sp.]
MIELPAHLLVVDDDERIRGLLQKFLIRNGFLVSTARDAAQARRLLAGLEFDMLVLDVMMPGEDGISLTRALRATLTVPILLLTAKGETNNRIEGFEAGADDYLIKPFEPKELLLRINAILRRVPAAKASSPAPKVLHMGPVRYDMDRGELWRGQELIRLTSTEAALMRIFSAQPGTAMSRDKLVGDMPREDSAGQERAVDVQITRLRRKIEDDPKSPRYLQTVRGEGYMLQTD